MVSLPVLLASPQGEKGETYMFTAELIEELKRAEVRTDVYMTPSMSFAACGGCLTCETKGECIVKDDIQSLQESMLVAPGFILATPVYLMGPPGRLKCLLDRFWPWSLRPQLFGKYAALVITAGSYGALDVSEYLSAILESWGYQVLTSIPILVKSRDAVEQRKKGLLESRLMSRRLVETIEKKKKITLSSAGKRLVKNIWGLIRDNQQEFANSYTYWQENDIASKFGI